MKTSGLPYLLWIKKKPRVLLFLAMANDGFNRSAAEKSVFGESAQRMQARVWEEVIGILAEKVPEVKDLARARL